MKTTREGRRFLALAFLIGIAAVNTGNNLIYLILALMLSVSVLAVVLLKVNLSGLTVDISVGEPVFAGEPAHAAVLVRNKKRLPSYSLRISTDGAASPAYCGVIPAGGSLEKEVALRFKTRGLHESRGFFAESSFPFILLKSRRSAGGSGGILVYPSLLETEDLIEGIYGASDTGRAMRGASGDEIYSVRDYRFGDDRRRVHWKATAKKAGLMVKEYAVGEYRRATIVIDNLRVSGAERSGPGEEERRLSELFEKVVSVAGSLARDLIERGYPVRLMSCRKVVPFGTGRDHLFRILDILAVLGEESSWESPLPGGDGPNVFVLKSRESSSHVPVVAGGAVVYADSL